MSWLYQRYLRLLAGEFGHQLVGWSGVATLPLLISGIYALWLAGSWREALAFKRSASPIRRLHDYHKLFGLWSMAVLTILDGDLGLATPPGPQHRH